MNNTTATRIAALFGALAVGLGAFGAHALKPLLTEHNALDIWETAVFYHFIHAIMLFLLAGRRPLPRGPWFCFLAGIVIFSGSLYLLGILNARRLGAVTPMGGVSFIAGWVWLMVAREKSPESDR